MNLRFSLDEQGQALVRYEAKPEGEPLPDGRLPMLNGGFDAQPLMSWAEFSKLYPPTGEREP